MTNIKQRAQWAEHMKDEATAHDVQQASAGESHTPLAGPLPYSTTDLEEAVRTAVTAERERCAGIAAEWSGQARLRETWPALTQGELRLAQQWAEAVRAQIRRSPA